MAQIVREPYILAVFICISSEQQHKLGDAPPTQDNKSKLPFILDICDALYTSEALVSVNLVFIHKGKF